jgi:MYXO-CTERM domain-containing protein
VEAAVRKAATALALTLSLLFASQAVAAAQSETTLPDNPATDDSSEDDDNFDDWGLFGLLGLLGLAGLAGRKRREPETYRATGTGSATAR